MGPRISGLTLCGSAREWRLARPGRLGLQQSALLRHLNMRKTGPGDESEWFEWA